MTTGATLDQALSAIYDAALSPERVPAMLDRLAALFRSPVACMMTRSFDRSRLDGVAFGLDRGDYGHFVRTWLPASPWAARSSTLQHAGEVISTRAIMPPSQLRRTAMYQEYLGPRGCHEGVRLTTWQQDNLCRSISILRPWSAGAFESEELALGRALMGHLRRGAAVMHRLQEADLYASAALGALDSVHCAVLLLDRVGRIAYANRSAEALLSDAGGGLTAKHGQLRAADAASDGRLAAVLLRAAGRGTLRAEAGAVRVPRRPGRAVLSLIAMPLVRPEAAWQVPGGPAVLVCVSDPQARSSVSHRHLVELFGLTGSEAGLAAELLAGHELREIAEQRGRSINTVRTQLARLMAKTDMSRQSELLKMLARLPGSGPSPG